MSLLVLPVSPLPGDTTMASFASRPEGMDQKKRKRASEGDSVSSGLLNFLGRSSPMEMPTPQTPAWSTSSEQSDISKPQQQQTPPITPHSRPKLQARLSKRLHMATTEQSRLSQPSTPLTSPLNSEHAGKSCHICLRRPKFMKELALYSACGSCSSRTCNVCMRSCDGPRCAGRAQDDQQTYQHEDDVEGGYFDAVAASGRRVCARCCHEVGVDGRVWCNECYDEKEEYEDYSVGKSKKELQLESAGRISNWLESFHGIDIAAMDPDGGNGNR